MTSDLKYPIIFIHNGNSEYLPYSLMQVKVTNPDAEIILLGDAQNRSYSKIVRHVISRDYFEGANNLAKHYRHHSTNGHDYELFCLQRWFILLDYLKQHQISKCLYIDSDILYFGHAETNQQLTAEYELTCVLKSPHTCFVNSIEGLEKFCKFILWHYTTEVGEANLNEYLAEHYAINGQAGGISDMTFFLKYKQSYPDRMLDLNQVFGEETFDLTMDTALDYVLDGNGLKSVAFDNADRPWVFNNRLGKPIRFNTLHFQGHCKAYISQYVKQMPPNFSSMVNSWARERFVQRIKQKVVKLLKRA